jgi:glycosyltransferase involved in cell wall biosynthesis
VTKQDAPEQRYLGFIDAGRRFACAVRDDLRRREPPRPDTLFFAYDTAALETMAWLREHNVRCLLGQMDPGRVEDTLVRAEEKRWPGWVEGTAPTPEAYFQRREREWALADCIIVNSEFSRQGLIAQGVPAAKLEVVPLCYESDAAPLSAAPRGPVSARAPLQVLFLGQVILRKGIPYLIEAARDLVGEPVQFHVVGPIGISREAVASAPPNLFFHGRATRDQAADWYRRADVFVLPTLSDGFAVTQIEAMAHGLPVITTPCCGEVVTPEVDGFLVPAREPAPLRAALLRYVREPKLLAAHREAARAKAGQFKLAGLRERLIRLEARLFSS